MIDTKARAQERKDKGYTDDGPSSNFLKSAGKFVMSVVNWEWFRSAKGTPGIMFRLVVLEGDHAGEVLDVDFWLSANALFMLADFAIAFGFEEPFDENNTDHIERVVTHGVGAVVVVVQTEGYQKNNGSAGVKYVAKFFNRYKGQAKDSWQEHIATGEKSFDGYLKWRETNPRMQPGQAPRQQQQQASGGGGGSADDVEIPF